MLSCRPLTASVGRTPDENYGSPKAGCDVTMGLDEFVTQYAKAYEAYDAERIAEFFFCPCVFLRQDTAVLLDTPAKIRDFLGTALLSYRVNGCTNFVAKLLEGRRLGTRFALVDLGWTMTSTGGKMVMQFQTTYNVVDDTGRWKIYAITRHD